jgi:hypothetical protein
LFCIQCSDDTVKIKCEDETGNIWKKALTNGCLFRYQQADTKALKKTLFEDSSEGGSSGEEVKLIKGFGDLTITATNSCGMKTSETIQPTPV